MWRLHITNLSFCTFSDISSFSPNSDDSRLESAQNTSADLLSSEPSTSPEPLDKSRDTSSANEDTDEISREVKAKEKLEESLDGNRCRKGRTIYKAQQVFVLDQVFSRTHYPDPEVIENLSKDLDISENKIKVIVF